MNEDTKALLRRTNLPKGIEFDQDGRACAEIGSLTVHLRQGPDGTLMALCPLGSIASLTPERTAFVMRGLLKLNLPGEEQSPFRFCMDANGTVSYAGIFKSMAGQEDLFVSGINGYIDELPPALLRFRSLAGAASGQDEEEEDLLKSPQWGGGGVPS